MRSFARRSIVKSLSSLASSSVMATHPFCLGRARQDGSMKTTAWGSQGLEASIEGLGAMGMSAFYGDRDDEESTATLNRALDLGVSLIDTAEIYGPFLNEQLIQR